MEDYLRDMDLEFGEDIDGVLAPKSKLFEAAVGFQEKNKFSSSNFSGLKTNGKDSEWDKKNRSHGITLKSKGGHQISCDSHDFSELAAVSFERRTTNLDEEPNKKKKELSDKCMGAGLFSSSKPQGQKTKNDKNSASPIIKNSDSVSFGVAQYTFQPANNTSASQISPNHQGRDSSFESPFITPKPLVKQNSSSPVSNPNTSNSILNGVLSNILTNPGPSMDGYSGVPLSSIPSSFYASGIGHSSFQAPLNRDHHQNYISRNQSYASGVKQYGNGSTQMMEKEKEMSNMMQEAVDQLRDEFEGKWDQLVKHERWEVGIDEAGKSLVLGPMVFLALYWPQSLRNRLNIFGFRDKKKLNEEERILVFEMINQLRGVVLDFKTRVIHPRTISSMVCTPFSSSLKTYEQKLVKKLIKDLLDDNLALGHVTVHNQAGDPMFKNLLTEHFSNKKKQKSLQFSVGSKSSPVVSAASLCVERELEKKLAAWNFEEFCLSSVTQKEFGSGNTGDPITRKWLYDVIDPVFGFPSLVRYSWNNTKELWDKKVQESQCHRIRFWKEKGLNSLGASFGLGSSGLGTEGSSRESGKTKEQTGKQVGGKHLLDQKEGKKKEGAKSKREKQKKKETPSTSQESQEKEPSFLRGHFLQQIELEGNAKKIFFNSSPNLN